MVKLSQAVEDWCLPLFDKSGVPTALRQLVSLNIRDECLETIQHDVTQQVEPFVIAALVELLVASGQR